MDTRKIIDEIVCSMMSLEEITAAGLTGKLEASLEPGESDIDIFVFCEEIPDRNQRERIYVKFLNEESIQNCDTNVYEGGVWGVGDRFYVNGVETWLMFFTIKETSDTLDAVLGGQLLDAESGFYPTGRCSTIQNMEVLKDKTGVIDSLKNKIQIYPELLRKKMADHHLDLSYDGEDFGRALLRRDVLFYHQVLESALDHFLQALFAINRTYFPSRKRTLQYIEGFATKPVQCTDRLSRVVELGSRKEGIAESSRIWHELVHELIDRFRDTGTTN